MWPFAQIARSAAAWQPDLILYVGNYFYRDDPCPAGNAGCAGSLTGDTWAAARADFFAPAAPLLEVVPWIFVRDNHEACDRIGQAWSRLLDSGTRRKRLADHPTRSIGRCATLRLPQKSSVMRYRGLSNSFRSATTTSAPLSSRTRGCPRRSTPITKPNPPARPA